MVHVYLPEHVAWQTEGRSERPLYHSHLETKT